MRHQISDGQSIYGFTVTEWQRAMNQDVYTRHICWVGRRTLDPKGSIYGGQWTTAVPVFQVESSHWVSYTKPALGEDDIDSIGYVADDLASSLCTERLLLYRVERDPWSLPPQVTEDGPGPTMHEYVQFAKAEAFPSREVLAMPVGLVEGWQLGDARARLDQQERGRG